MKLFKLNYHGTTVIAAKNASDAIDWAQDERREIAEEAEVDAIFEIGDEIKSVDDLPDGWTKFCIPFGDSDMSTVKDMLASAAQRLEEK